MPIPKVGDVIELHGQPSVGGDWHKLGKNKLWIVEWIRPRPANDYWRLRLRSYETGEIVRHDIQNDGTWPLNDKEFSIQPFLTSVRNAIQSKENQHDEPASK
jgi:hypothetical protein